MDRLKKEASAAIKAGRYDHASISELAELEAKEPQLPQDCEFFWIAFRSIASMRPTGMGVSKLRWDDTMKYADRYNLTLHESEMLWSIISSLDEIVLEEHRNTSST